MLNAAFAVALVVIIGLWQARHLLGRGDIAPPLDGPLLRIDRQANIHHQSAEGQDFSLTTKSGKTTLVYFFAPWCGVCRVSAGNLEWVSKAFGDNVAIVAVALDFETVESVSSFVRDVDLGSVPTVLGSEAVRDVYQINAYPSYYVIDKDGRVFAASVGYSSFIGMVARILLS